MSLHIPNTAIHIPIRVKHVCLHQGVDNYNLYHSEVINISRFSPALSHVYPLHLEIHFNFASQCCSCFWELCVKWETERVQKDASGRGRPAEIERLGVCLCLASHHFLSNYHTHIITRIQTAAQYTGKRVITS